MIAENCILSYSTLCYNVWNYTDSTDFNQSHSCPALLFFGCSIWVLILFFAAGYPLFCCSWVIWQELRLKRTRKIVIAVSLEVMTQLPKIANVFFFFFSFFLMESESRETSGPENRSVAEAEIFSGVVYRVRVLWVDSQGPVTHAHAHKQGFGPLEKITLIITGCIRTFPLW